MSYRLITYNIHKGFNFTNREFILSQIKNILHESHADFLCLQEIIGSHATLEVGNQLEYIADKFWPHYQYGKNAVYPDGNHGNAILSKFPINFYHNTDLTLHSLEQRGLLHTKIEVENRCLNILTTHLNLLEIDRLEQMQIIIKYIKTNIASDEPLILCGDFNDWSATISSILQNQIELDEIFLKLSKRHAKTFPCFYPILPLDRVYFKNLKILEASVLKPERYWNLSDHLPVSFKFKF
jgi:endonuclease/exonuclease/phosphatase family metal-dependent hydrolase